MKNKLIPIITIIVVLGGIGAFILISGNDEAATERTADSANSTQAQANNSSTPNTQSEASFNAASTTDSSFVATIATEGSQGNTNGVMEYDKSSGNLRFTTTVEGEKSQLIYTKDAYYICQNDTSCFKTSLGQGNSAGFDKESYEFSSEEIARFKNLASYQGQKDCKAGTCDTWQIIEGGQTNLIFIDKKTDRIVKVENSYEGGKNIIEYDYRDVSIAVPTNAQELPSLQGIGN